MKVEALKGEQPGSSHRAFQVQETVKAKTPRQETKECAKSRTLLVGV